MGSQVCGNEQASLNPHLKSGNDNYLSGNYQQALDDYNKAI
jgi:hypothetical protein